MAIYERLGIPSPTFSYLLDFVLVLRHASTDLTLPSKGSTWRDIGHVQGELAVHFVDLSMWTKPGANSVRCCASFPSAIH